MSIFFSLLPFKLFQFPTGWNSTQEKARSRYFKFMVSIPNGMEFYASGSDYVRFDNVSIPNGMEFYTSILSFGLPSMAGFNSQRDGILPRVKFPPNFGPRVSIPNGMEFYFKWIFWFWSLVYVSIPNGMEFYFLTYSCTSRPQTVSIPNGMEFYGCGDAGIRRRR